MILMFKWEKTVWYNAILFSGIMFNKNKDESGYNLQLFQDFEIFVIFFDGSCCNYISNVFLHVLKLDVLLIYGSIKKKMCHLYMVKIKFFSGRQNIKKFNIKIKFLFFFWIYIYIYIIFKILVRGGIPTPVYCCYHHHHYYRY
jgi:hypothetical protein